MKTNERNCKTGEYYVGLDVGTSSSGWAVTDTQYNLLRVNGKDMWGARLFEEAETAKTRRTNRTMRRRLARRKHRLMLLEELFAPEILKVDPNFFQRMHESSLWMEERTEVALKYIFFNEEGYTDKDMMKEYPTMYHLRHALIHEDKEFDVRLVYLALHHLMKSRGHFLYDSSDTGEESLQSAFDEMCIYFTDNDQEFKPANKEAFLNALCKKTGKTVKADELKEAYGPIKVTDDPVVDIAELLKLLAGSPVKADKLFKDESLKDALPNSIKLDMDLDENFDKWKEALQDRMDLIVIVKRVFDLARFDVLLAGQTYLCDAKVLQFNQNKKDLRVLKKWVKQNKPAVYDDIFVNTEKNNFAEYTKYKSAKKACTQDEMCTFVRKNILEMKNSTDTEEQRVYSLIEAKEFFPKLKGTINGLVPYQLQGKEVDAILAKASAYLPFLTEKDAEGLSIADKVKSTFEFRIPYYVGPLNTKSDRAWLERDEAKKIYPWNFDAVVDKAKSAEKFMSQLIGRCTYTNDPVLPLNSLIYEKFMVLNEINNLKIDGNPIEVRLKQDIFEDLFVKNKNPVGKKTLLDYLKSKGYPISKPEITGFDSGSNGNGKIKSTLKSYHAFKQILDKTGNDYDQVESIIKRVIIYGDDKKMLKKWLKDNTHDLDDSDIKYICKMKFKDWGRLSKTLLSDICYTTSDGEMMSILDLLYETNENLMQILHNEEYGFMEKIEEYKKKNYGEDDSLEARLEEMYISPKVKRSIRQTVRIMDEIVSIEKCAPKKIMIEMARPDKDKMIKKCTESRKKTLQNLYESCEEDVSDLKEKLDKETDQSLRRDKLYLYYLQMGRCAYSGEPIDLEQALKDKETYDIDHIFPQSKIKDDSIDNRVLVKSKLNREKTNVYPIHKDIRTKMLNMWKVWYEKGLISSKKFDRLKRNYPLTDDELKSFIARQLTETQQATKALATVLQEKYPSTKIVYSKAGNVSDFRHEFDILKCRDINDLHHAKDAYLNIVVGNVYDTKFTSKFMLNLSKQNYSLKRVFDYDVENAWVAPTEEELKKYRDSEDKAAARTCLSGTFKTVYKNVFKNTPIVTFAPYKKKGELFKVTIQSQGKGQLAVKKGKGIDKYGGYDKISGSYFCAVEHVEHKDKKKVVRTLEPVYLVYEKEYRKNPINYCKEILKLKDCRIIYPVIRFNALLELDGKKMFITGRSDDRILFKHAYQFVVDDEHSKYIRNISKYILRYDNNHPPVGSEECDGITNEDNVKMYDWMIKRLESKVYAALPLSNVSKSLNESREKFAAMTVLEQCKILKEILKSFKCNRELTNLLALNGKKSVGELKYNKKLTSFDSAYLINQSVTGLYEKKIDLLK